MLPFQAHIWPEHQLPVEAEGCSLCTLQHKRKRIIWGEGNPHASLYFLLDNPGARETKEDVPFVCGTRETLQRAVHEAGFSPEEIYVTYVLKCRPIRAYPKEEARRACMPYLSGQLQKHSPSILCCLGNVALQSFIGDPEAEVKSWRGKIVEMEGQLVTASYHPLAVRRRPNLWPYMMKDMELIRSLYLEHKQGEANGLAYKPKHPGTSSFRA